MSDYILQMENITKTFPGVVALDDVNLDVSRGEIHALIGENGAGKSTLMKVLSGLYPAQAFEGRILIDGNEQAFATIKDSEAAGVAVIYQELALVKQMNVAENIFLGNEIKDGASINWHKSYAKARELLDEVGLKVDPQTKIINLGIGGQQLIEIAKALYKNARILVLDEPTAALNESDSENLLGIVRNLRAKGVTCIYISHKLEEVRTIADSITILRDGQTVATRKPSEGDDISETHIISLMVGRELKQRFPRVEHAAGETLMQVRDWNVYNPELPDKKVIKNVSFDIRKGEILGIAGLMGAGRTELATSLFGAYGVNRSGTITIKGERVEIASPFDAIRHGLGYVTEDRKGKGLVMGMNIIENTGLASHFRIAPNGVLNKLQEILETSQLSKRLQLKMSSLEQHVRHLSGGNQQKVVLAKWLMTKPQVLILDEPTRGIDVGAKFEIYNIMNKLVEDGVGVVMISSELPEILGITDRILVMREGSFAGELNWKEATQESVMHLATGWE
ncbi:MAG: sugar ABC transporter ATP-binding protein [Spirochaetales bacterium]